MDIAEWHKSLCAHTGARWKHAWWPVAVGGDNVSDHIILEFYKTQGVLFITHDSAPFDIKAGPFATLDEAKTAFVMMLRIGAIT